MSEPLTWSHRASAIPEAGLRERRTATPQERRAVAEALGIICCDELTADYGIRATGGGRYAMEGTVSARLTQQCVVTLEPITQTLEETFAVELWPPDSLPRATEGEVEVLSLPEVEPIEHGMIAAGRIAFEVVAAAVDPYPRRESAQLAWDEAEAGGAERTAGPFAVLKTLKDKG